MNNHFVEGYPSLTLAWADHLEPTGSRRGLLKSTFNAENFVGRLSWSIFSHFGAMHSIMRVAAGNREKLTNAPYFGGSRSFNLIDVDITIRSSSPVLVMISSMSVPICNYFHVRRAINSRMTFLRECPFFSPSFEGTPLPSGMKFCHKILEAMLLYGENSKSLSHLGLERHW